MTIKIEMLRCFVIVAQTGNLTDAANQLGRTQSAVSMTLKQFEAHLGERLFETERKNRLTPQGEEIFQLARRQLQQFDETVGAIETTARAPQGLLRIASVPSVTGLVFPSAIQTMTQRHSGLKIELRDADSVMITDLLVQGQADLGIVSGQPSLNGVEQKRLFQDPFGLVCASDHPLARQQKSPTLDQVVSAGFVDNGLCRLIETHDVQAALATARVTVHNTQSLIGMARTGTWVTILPKTVVRVLPDDLAFRSIEGFRDQRSVSLLIRERSPLIDLAREFGQLLTTFNWNEITA